MKRTLLGIMLINFAFISFGQIVITNADILPIGSSMVIAYDTMPAGNIVPGDAGANKTWDFTDVEANNTSTFEAVEPTGLPFADEFPGANYAMQLAEDTLDVYTYLDRNNDKMSLLGFVMESEQFTLPWHINPGDIMLDFPVEYQNTYNEMYVEESVFASPEPGADSIKIKSSVEETTTIDAWGKLMIPLGSYDVLRQKIENTSTDSTFFQVAGNWMFFFASEWSSTSYSWWTNDPSVGFQVFDLSVDEDSGETTDISFLFSTTVGLPENSNVESRVYPNPVKDVMFVEFEKPMSGEITLLNVQGQVVARQNIDHTNRIQLSVSQLPEGIYVYRFTDHSGNPVSSGKVLKR